MRLNKARLRLSLAGIVLLTRSFIRRRRYVRSAQVKISKLYGILSYRRPTEFRGLRCRLWTIFCFVGFYSFFLIVSFVDRDPTRKWRDFREVGQPISNGRAVWIALEFTRAVSAEVRFIQPSQISRDCAADPHPSPARTPCSHWKMELGG